MRKSAAHARPLQPAGGMTCFAACLICRALQDAFDAELAAIEAQTATAQQVRSNASSGAALWLLGGTVNL